MNGNKIFIICGPTACGKTAAAVELAKAIDGEVISADSAQIYKHMDIGTAKVSFEEKQGIPHHLIDELEPNEPYNAAIFKKRAGGLIDEIAGRGKMPIICGGTGFYINALLYNADFEAGVDRDLAYRAELTQIAQTLGAAHLHNMLREADAEAADQIDPNNIKRVVRALEFKKLYARPISLHNREQQQKRADTAYDAQIFVLHGERQRLYERINKRVDKMLARGLVQEVEGLLQMGYSPKITSMQALGYKEIVRYLQGDCTLEGAADAVKQGTRRFAKRQLTWFKHQTAGACWIDVEEYQDYFAMVGDIIRIGGQGLNE